MTQDATGLPAALDQRWRDLGEFIRDQRRIGQLSLRKLSEQAGISNPYLSQIERGLRKPSAEILRQIASALEISSETLYVRAGILDERDGAPDLVAEIRRDPHITEEQKKTLVHIYQSFREQAGAPGAEGADAVVGDDLAAYVGDGEDPITEPAPPSEADLATPLDDVTAAAAADEVGAAAESPVAR